MSLTSRLSIGLAFGLLLGLSTPLIIPEISHNSVLTTAQAQTQPTVFSDVPANYWAHDYIAGLARLNIISGFGDGTFHPNESVTRAQFAAILRKAFLQSQPTTAQPFTDVPPNYWATEAIYAARSAGFLSGYPDNRFAPNNFITRENALISLANGLKYAEGSPDALSAYQDVDSISNYALPGVRAAAQANLVVNYPNLDQISPYRPASRADVAAFVYQALVKAGRAEPLAASAIDRWQTQPLVTLPAQSEQMSFSQTGQQLATIAINRNSFQIWNIQTGQLIKEITAADQTRFSSIAISHDGKRVATISDNLSTNATKLSVWTAATGEQLWQTSLDTPQQPDYPLPFGGHLVQVAFTPNDSEVVAQLVVSTSSSRAANNQLRFYQAATGEAVQSLDTVIADGARIDKIAFSPDGQFFASAQQGGVDVWRRNRTNRFESLRTLPAPEGFSGFLDMVFTNSGTLNISTLTGQTPLATARLDVWNIQTDEQPSRTDYTAWDRTDVLTRLSPDGKYYFVRGDVAGGRLNNVQTGEQQNPRTDYSDTAAAFSGDGDYLAIANEQNISIFTKTTN
ncbi:S-layer homology domain-containing protein [Leptolyngbya sp. BC1307]|uniref:S-layer homology domain-containing protein n=1 Tax=Leptolyngbya sp. BC1307 TaxID=2029589 RepID=UPI000EFD2695|nr:S-layer homology domain-containing protein [Leptolyngbya sp. BC1307]